MNFPDGAAHEFRSRDLFRGAKYVFAQVVGVNVTGNKINRNIIFHGVSNEAIDPSGLRRRRPTDAQPAIDLFQSPCSGIVKLKIGLVLGRSRPEIKVGFVPDLEIPLGNLINAVAFDQVAREMGDEVVPFVPIFWRRNVWLVPERMKGRLRGKLPGHEAQFYKWTNMICQQAIIDLIDVRKIVDGLSFRILVVQADLIMENRMKSYIFEAGHFLDFAPITPIAVG